MNSNSEINLFFLLVWGARLGITGLVIAAALSLDTASTEQFRDDIKQDWQLQVDEIDLGLQAEILQNMQTVWGLAANVAVDPNFDNNRFIQLAPVIFRLSTALKNIGLAPDLTIRHIYPPEGNEAALGLDLTTQSLPPEDLESLKETRRALFSGPIDLVQGGQGLASRIPIFTEETDEFWGVISVILDLNKLYEIVNLAERQHELRFVLSVSDNPSDADAIFFGPQSGHWKDPVSSTLRMPGITWTIFAEPAEGWPRTPENPLVFRASLGLVATLIIGALFWLTHLMLREREMQLRLHGLFELAPIGVGLFNARTGRLISANPAFSARFGPQCATLDFFEHGFKADGSPMQETLGIRQTLRSMQRIEDLQVYYPNREHAVLPVRIRGVELLKTSREPVIWLIIEDISEQKKIERMKNDFISTVSHELRTPLTSISGSLGLLANNAAGELPEGMEKLITIAHRNSLQLTHLINDLLDIDKLVAGKMPFHMEPISVPQWLKDSIENISQFASQRNVELDLAPPPELQVNADRQRLDQALNNLLSNAIKFSPSGATVSVSVDQHKHLLRVYVRDEGEGVPPDFHQRIFQKFSQADSSSRRKKGGTGLGLAITRELMKQMGGAVGYESNPGEGATFWLELPISEAGISAAD